MTGKIYLIPNTLGDSSLNSVIPTETFQLVNHIEFFIVENIRNARRYLKKLDIEKSIDEITFFELNKHTDKNDIQQFIEPAFTGSDIGIISEAGCPGIADPGAVIVEMAHQFNIRVIPLVGPSSVMLAIMASGLNGQNFAFVGYLPVKKHERINRIKTLENRSKQENQTQVFIETPYRNIQLTEALLKTCAKNTRLCIAADITLPSQFIHTMTIAEWKGKIPRLNKRPAIFLLHKP